LEPWFLKMAFSVFDQNLPKTGKKGSNPGNSNMILKKNRKEHIEYQKNLEMSLASLPDSVGYIIPEEGEKTSKVSQAKLKSIVPIQAAKKMFSLSLEGNDYMAKYTRNGRFLLLAGRDGHFSSFDWQSGRLNFESKLEDNEVIRDITWLHNETFLALAQKNYVYMYDHSGTEVHRLKKHQKVHKLDFLPWHYLLVSSSEDNFIRYQDVSTGNLVAEYSYKGQLGGKCTNMAQNQQTGVMNLAHANGVVSLWSPSQNTPLARILCHKGPILSLAVDSQGVKMATAGADGKLKIWDLRNYQKIDEYYTLRPADSLDFSQRGLLAVGNGPNVTIWKELGVERQSAPYLSHLIPGQNVSSIKFCPFEDILGVGHSKGFDSVLVPGSGEPNFDSLNANPFATKKQRQEAEVHSLLDKLPPDTIGLDREIIGAISRDHQKESIPAKLDLMGKKPSIKKNKVKSSMKRYLSKRSNIIDEHKMKAKENLEVLRYDGRERNLNQEALTRFNPKQA
jgi:U3 small nucleolar RNA-associated protein 7